MTKLSYSLIAATGLMLSMPAFAQSTAPVTKADPTPARSETRAEHKAYKEPIKSTYKADKDSCDGMKANAKDVCEAEAKAKRDIALAEHEAAEKNTPANMRKVALAKADGTYHVAKEKCDDLKGNEKDACQKDAKANHDRAKAEAKANAKVSEARSDAREEHREAAKERAKGS